MPLALIAAFALGGCGGGGGSSDSTERAADKYTGSTEPLAITTDNSGEVAEYAAAAALQFDPDPAGVVYSRDRTWKSGDAAFPDPGRLFHDLQEQFIAPNLGPQRTPRVTERESGECSYGGTYSLEMSMANSAGYTAGDRLTLRFSNCREGDGRLNGGLVVTITGVSPYGFAARVDYQEFGAESLSSDDDLYVHGALDLAYSDDDVTESIRSYGDSLYLRAGAAHALLTAFDFNTAYSWSSDAWTHNSDFTVAGTDIDGRIEVDTTEPFTTASGEVYPYAGRLVVTGEGGAKLRLTAVDSMWVDVDTDLEGDGSWSEVQRVRWSDLGTLSTTP